MGSRHNSFDISILGVCALLKMQFYTVIQKSHPFNFYNNSVIRQSIYRKKLITQNCEEKCNNFFLNFVHLSFKLITVLPYCDIRKSFFSSLHQ